MKPMKQEMIRRNGMRCMLCGENVKYSEINYHHIKPKYVFKKEHMPVDESYENGSLLCVKCHFMVHFFKWEDKEYQTMMELVRQNKK